MFSVSFVHLFFKQKEKKVLVLSSLTFFHLNSDNQFFMQSFHLSKQIHSLGTHTKSLPSVFVIN